MRMKSPRIEIPTGQNWSCHGCTDWCRHHLLVPLSAEDVARSVGKDCFTTDGNRKKWAAKP